MASDSWPGTPDRPMMSDSELFEEARRRYQWAEREAAFLVNQLSGVFAAREAAILALRAIASSHPDLRAAVRALLGERGEPA